MRGYFRRDAHTAPAPKASTTRPTTPPPLRASWRVPADEPAAVLFSIPRVIFITHEQSKRDTAQGRPVPGSDAGTDARPRCRASP